MITQSLITGSANYIKDRITKVRLNNSYEITSFVEKAVSTDTVGLRYLVPVSSGITTITNIRLRDSSNTDLTNNTVSIPLSGDLMQVQTIKVREEI